MHDIILICTRHKEAGACNSAELVKIIEEYQPDVIFEELAPITYDACYTYNPWGLTKINTVETDAIKIYRQYNTVVHVPMLSAEMHEDLHLMQRMVENEDLQALVENLDLSERIYGFPFLNSSQCQQRFEEIKALEKSTLQNNQAFQKAYQCVDNYEHDMLKNIYQYSAEHKYNNGVMFIGAAHRKTITQKIQEYHKQQALKLNWTFYNPTGN